MILRPRRLRAQPGTGRLVLDEYLASKCPLVASPYLGNGVSVVDGTMRVEKLGSSPTPTATTDRGIAYRLPGNSSDSDSFQVLANQWGMQPYSGSISAWTAIAIVRSASGSTDSNGVVLWQSASGGNRHIVLWPANFAGGVLAGASFYDGSWHASGISTAIMSDGQWHVIAGSYSGSNYLRYYLDGKLDSQNTTSIPATGPASATVIDIGRNHDNGQQWMGDILLVVLVAAALDDSYLKRATKSVDDCWSTLFRPRRFVRSSFVGGGGGAGAVAYRWFLQQ